MATGCYQSPYLPASFKFVNFKAMEVTSQHGRRGAEGEFPFGEQTAYADLGRKIRTYGLTARFDGNDHVLRAAALIAVCELKNPGPLVHPTRGVIVSAACKSLRVTDKVETEQGVTIVDMEFVEANNWPNGLSLVSQVLGFAFGGLVKFMCDHLLARYKPKEVPVFRTAQVTQTAQEQVSAIQLEYGNATFTRSNDVSRNRTISDLDRLANDQTMALNSTTVATALTEGMRAVAANLTGIDKFRAMRRLANGAAKGSALTGVSAAAENAVYATVRVNAALYMYQAATELKDATSGALYEQADVIDALLQQEMAYAREVCDNELYLKLSDFKEKAVADLYRLAHSAPGTIRYDFGGRQHPLTAAYAVLGNAKRVREIETMNALQPTGRIGPSVYAVR